MESGNREIHDNIRQILQGNQRGLKAYEIQSRYASKFGRLYSESSITARCREMADVHCNIFNRAYRYTLQNGNCVG